MTTKIKVVREGNPRKQVVLWDLSYGDTFRFRQQLKDENIYMVTRPAVGDDKGAYIGLSTGSTHSSTGDKPVVRVACTLTYKDIE